jgi:hypothetical protein
MEPMTTAEIERQDYWTDDFHTFWRNEQIVLQVMEGQDWKVVLRQHSDSLPQTETGYRPQLLFRKEGDKPLRMDY